MADPWVSQTGENLAVFLENRFSGEGFGLTGCPGRSFAGVKIIYLKAFN